MTRILCLLLTLLLGATCCPATPAAPPARPDSTSFLAVRRPATGYGLAPDRATLREQVREPLFAFVFTMVERDSLGTWTADDLLAFAASWGEDSSFPLAEHLASITREALSEDEVLTHRGVTCRRRWLIRLEPLRFEMPMPYSILGYHPGTLSFDSPFELYEWRLGSRNVHVTVEGQTRKYEAEALTVFQLTAGWIILDVDGWLDRLLGKAADDAAMQGFTVGWVEDRLVGIGNSVGRGGRRILGELDFRTGEVENNGRPVARGLSAYSRGWTRPPDGDHRDVWQEYDR